MIKLFTDEQFNIAKWNTLLPCKCYMCNITFYKSKHQIQNILNPNQHKTGAFCSKKCAFKAKETQVEVDCVTCNIKFKKQPHQIKKSKSGNHFCSSSCAAKHNNTHKSHGTRRSKLEIHIERELTLLYPNLEINFNTKEAINSELDIYIPTLRLAFELNGIFHYEPIYGPEKLSQIQNNDQRKFQACIENDINFCIIDTSQQKYFKENTAKKYLDIITNIIKERLST